MSPTVTRHFATVPSGRFGARQVHYRRAGRGPCVLLLHQSPLSSRDVLPMISRLQGRFTCIAPDTPGYGLSDPFGPAEVEMDDVARAVVEFADTIGVDRFALYGFHTGAMIAVAVGRLYPDRVSCVAANGFLVPDEDLRAELLARYLPEFRPSWDGSHLAWLWARLREQAIFFPWYRKDQASRMNFDLPPPGSLQDSALDFLRAGDNYRVGYRAAFTFRGEEALADTRCPTLLTAADADPLAADLLRITAPSAAVRVTPGGGAPETLALCEGFLSRHPAPEPPPAPPTAPLAGRTWQQMVDVPGGQLRVRRNTDHAGRPVVVLHDAASSCDQVDPVARSFIGHRPVLAIDLPGHGESDDTLGEGGISVGGYAGVLRQVLDSLGVAACDVVGLGGGGLVGLELALADTRVARLVMAEPPCYPPALRGELKEELAPSIEPVWHGGHLLQAWHLLRDQQLFWPWYRRSKAGILWHEPQVEPERIHARLVDLLKASRTGRLACLAQLDYPVEERLARLQQPVTLCAPASSPQLEALQEALRASAHCRHTVLPERIGEWAPAIRSLLDA